MKCRAIFILLTLLVHSAQAATNIELDLQPTVNIKFSERIRYENSIKCYWKAKGDDYIDHGAQVINGTNVNGEFTNNTTVRYVHSSASPIAVTPRSLDIQITNSKAGSIETVAVTATDNMNSGTMSATIDGTGCRTSVGSAVASKPIIHGNIHLGYRVPKDTWIIKVTRSKFNGIFSSENSSHFADAINASYDVEKSETVLLWVTPGQTIKQSFGFNYLVPAGAALGTYTLSFEPLGISFTESHKFSKSLSNTLKLIKSFLQLKANERPNDDKLNQLTSDSWDAIQTLRTTLGQSMLRQIPTRELQNLTTSIYEMANGHLLAGKAAVDAKMSSAVLGYELAAYLFAEFMPYCKTINIKFPFQDQEKAILGVRAAYFWVSRARNVLALHNTEDVHRFLKDLVLNESNGRTYLDVMQDIEERRRLRVSQRRVGAVANVFRSAKFDLENVISHFGGFGSSVANSDLIIEELAKMNQLSSQFSSAYFQHLRRYTYTNSDKIEATPLLIMLEQMTEQRMYLVNLLSQDVRFLSITENATTDSFMAELTGLLSHQFNLINGKLDNAMLDTIRQAYVHNRSFTKLSEKIYQCVKGGL